MKLVYPERNICSLNKPQTQELGTCKMKILKAGILTMSGEAVSKIQLTAGSLAQPQHLQAK
jgi:hypothetical protein